MKLKIVAFVQDCFSNSSMFDALLYRGLQRSPKYFVEFKSMLDWIFKETWNLNVAEQW